ncbi:PepSY-associated TM region [Sulfurivirga caldicuralii]|uniref:PepSY-associated TM region n=1 Tax=Sulfurivirga caldicuralii TaxID=364032 RepID=A0A1N6GRV2_9GAMM|nr:PepSY domain-containing protein [Sulfurivirga caldicuralii]SIO10264.1 PepSY-associated TM region [Sulfurivirga caldicuralii]
MKWRRFHHALALTGAIILLFLTGTGLLLNHSHDLKLDQRLLPNAIATYLMDAQHPHIRQSWMLAKTPIVSTDAGSLVSPHWLEEITRISVYTLSIGWLVVAGEKLFLYDKNGALITQLGKPPGQLAEAWPITFDDEKTGCSQLDMATLQWHPCSRPPVASTLPLPAQASASLMAREQVLQAWKRAQHLSWETLLLKLHNGTLFGRAGPWLLDAFGLLIIAMILSGLALRRRKH